MNAAELAVFAACYAVSLERQNAAFDNSAAETALDEALNEVENFRQALRERKR